MKKKNIGSSFDNWLREEGIYEEVTAAAHKRVLARQVKAAMKKEQLPKAEMARRNDELALSSPFSAPAPSPNAKLRRTGASLPAPQEGSKAKKRKRN